LELPIIVCPRCGFKHTVEFKAVKDESALIPLDELRLATAKPVLQVSRLCQADRTPLANDDISVTDYDKSNEFIIAFQLDEAKGPWTSTYTLMWRNVTDAGSFANIAATGEMAWGTGTSLVNGANVTNEEDRLCQDTGKIGSTWQAGEEVEGAATSDSIILADEAYTEIHFAVDPSSALDNKEYAFQIYENGGGSAVGAAACTLTTAAAGVDGNATPDGVGSTASNGDASGSGDANITVTGQSATAQLSDEVVTAVSTEPEGQEGTGTLGTATATGDADITATGQEATGTLTTEIGASGGSIPTGQSGTASVGTSIAAGGTNKLVWNPSLYRPLITSLGDAEALPDGVASTTAVGSVYAGGGSIPVGQEATAAFGTVVASGDADITATGQEATSTLGSAYAGGGSLVTGQEATSAVGDADATGDADITATGQEATSQLGTAVADGGEAADAEATPDGVGATSAVGTAVASSPGDAVVTGQEAVTALGDEVATGLWSLHCHFGSTASRFLMLPLELVDTAYPEGVSANAQVGTPGYVCDGNARCYMPTEGFRALDGQDGFLAPVSGDDGFYAPTELTEMGPWVTTALGTVSAVGVGGIINANIIPPGVEANGEVGTPTYIGDVNFDVTGVEATAQLGVAGATTFAYPLGVSATAQLGTATAITGVLVDGVSATAQLGTVLAESTTLVTGQEATASVGTPTAYGATLGEAYVSGVYATAAVGTPSVGVGYEVVISAGVEATAQIGTPATAVSTEPLGVEAVAGLGVATVEFTAIVFPQGVSAAAQLGIIGASGQNVVVFPSGQSVTAFVGAAVATGETVWDKLGTPPPSDWTKQQKQTDAWTKLLQASLFGR
jgi:hypothetical protein